MSSFSFSNTARSALVALIFAAPAAYAQTPSDLARLSAPQGVSLSINTAPVATGRFAGHGGPVDVAQLAQPTGTTLSTAPQNRVVATAGGPADLARLIGHTEAPIESAASQQIASTAPAAR
jgi:hypothetical protein